MTIITSKSRAGNSKIDGNDVDVWVELDGIEAKKANSIATATKQMVAYATCAEWLKITMRLLQLSVIHPTG